MADVALLAPVHLEHLQSALEKQAIEGRVEFSTNAVETLTKLAQLLDGHTTDVYIYEAGADAQGRVTWRAKFLGISDNPNPKYRPDSTRSDTRSLLYYDICDLHHLPEHEGIPISRFSGYGKKTTYASNYAPRRPTLVNPISN